MANIFEHISNRIQNSTFVLWVVLLAFMALGIGLIHFVEDTASSRMGLEQLQVAFGIVPAIFPIAYVTMSLAPQVGQIVFTYFWLMDRRRNWWALVVAVLFFGIDFIADVQARSGGTLFPVSGAQADMTVLAISSFLTIMYFTVGSELFITAGIGLILELFAPAIRQATKLWIDIQQTISDAQNQLQRSSRGRR